MVSIASILQSRFIQSGFISKYGQAKRADLPHIFLDSARFPRIW